jgi:hypothetical protein
MALSESRLSPATRRPCGRTRPRSPGATARGNPADDQAKRGRGSASGTQDSNLLARSRFPDNPDTSARETKTGERVVRVGVRDRWLTMTHSLRLTGKRKANEVVGRDRLSGPRDRWG